MATAEVDFGGLKTISLVSELETILEFDQNGPIGPKLGYGEEIPLKNGHAFVLEQKVQFLLDDGLKFEVKSENLKILLKKKFLRIWKKGMLIL